MSTATLSRRTSTLPAQLDHLADYSPEALDALVDELADARRARRWLTRLYNSAPDALVPHIELAQLSVLVEQKIAGSVVPGVMDIEAAIAHGNWQTAYDLAIRNEQPSAHALAGLMLLVDALSIANEADAVVNLLNRALDLYEGTPAVYWALIKVLTAMGRVDAAEAALELLRGSLAN